MLKKRLISFKKFCAESFLFQLIWRLHIISPFISNILSPAFKTLSFSISIRLTFYSRDIWVLLYTVCWFCLVFVPDDVQIATCVRYCGLLCHFSSMRFQEKSLPHYPKSVHFGKNRNKRAMAASCSIWNYFERLLSHLWPAFMYFLQALKIVYYQLKSTQRAMYE